MLSIVVRRLSVSGVMMAFLGLMAGCGGASSPVGGNQTATPAFSPGGGTYTASQTVTLSSATSGAVLYCTTDGSTPTTSSPQCAEPTTVFKSEFLQAIAVAPGLSPSSVASAGYTINLNAAATPTFSPAGGTYTSSQSVAIADATSGANVYYTTDGTVPTASSKLYNGPVSVSSSETISAIAAATGYANSGVASAVYVINPVPAIANIAPASAAAGGAAFTLTINGTNFVSGATVMWGNTALTTTYVSATQLTAAVPASLIAAPGTASITVADSAGTSVAAAFTINLGAPAIASIAPASAAAGGAAFTLTVNGTNFVSGATVMWGNTALTTTYVSATQLTAAVPATLIAAAGTPSVTVADSAGTSSAVAFTINAALPAVTSISPASAVSGSAGFTLTVNGANFVSSATVLWSGSVLTTTYVSSTLLTAVVPASFIATAGTASVTVADSAGTSAAAAFTINLAAPAISSISPISATVGGAQFTLTVNGTNFVSSATVMWGNTALTTTYVSAAQLTAVVPANLIAAVGTANVTVTDSGGTSAAAEFTISAPNVPTIASISPASATSGSAAFTLTVNGANFVSGATVMWGNTALTTTYVSATQLTAAVPAGLIATSGTTSITVTDSAGTSAGATFTISEPAPAITGISPASAAPGGPAFTLTINGANFNSSDSSTAVLWNGSPLTLISVSATQLTAAVPASLIATAGTASVTVTDAGGTSSTLTFTIAPLVSGVVASGGTWSNGTLTGASPVTGATVQLYAAGTAGYGSAPTALTVIGNVTTDSSGSFAVAYNACPAAPGDQLYLVATTANGGGLNGGTNPSIVLMAALGTCSRLPSTDTVTVNEVTTVAAAYALSGFAAINTNGGINIGAPGTGSGCTAANIPPWQSTGPNTCNYLGLVNAFNTANNIVNAAQGAVWAAPSSATWHTSSIGMTPAYANSTGGPIQYLNDSTIPTARINALADMLATCVQNLGSGCSALFSAAETTGASGFEPNDTLQAALNIALNPGNNVAGLLGLVPATNQPYATTLVLSGTGVPTDLILALTFTGAGLGLPPGTLATNAASGKTDAPVTDSGLAVDALGNVWVAGFDAASPGTSSISSADVPVIAGFNGIGAPLTPATTLNASTITLGGINLVQLETGQGNSIPALELGLSSIAIDQLGNLWVGSESSSVAGDDILEISDAASGNPSLSAATSLIKTSNKVLYLAIDAGEDVWAGNTSYIEEYSNTGTGLITGTVAATPQNDTDVLFDSNSDLWVETSKDQITGGTTTRDVDWLSNSTGADIFHAFSSTDTIAATLVADNSGNIYGCADTSKKLDQFTAANGGSWVNSANAPTIATGRACGNLLVMDGLGRLFAVTDAGGTAVVMAVDEFTTAGALISPLAGYNGTSSTEPITLNRVSTVSTTGIAAMDGSGNLWVINQSTVSTSTTPSTPGNAMIEFVGIGAPVLTPTSVALTNGVLGARP